MIIGIFRHHKRFGYIRCYITLTFLTDFAGRDPFASCVRNNLCINLVNLQPACVFDEIIKSQRLPPLSYNTHICQALIISRIFIRSFSMGGFLSAELKNRINSFFRRLYADMVTR